MRRVLLLLPLAAVLALPAPAKADLIDFGCTPAPASCDGWFRQPVTITWSTTDDSSTWNSARTKLFSRFRHTISFSFTARWKRPPASTDAASREPGALRSISGEISSSAI